MNVFQKKSDVNLPVGVAADPPDPLLDEVPTPELRDKTSSFPEYSKSAL